MENFDGVWELRIFYTTLPTGHTAMEHRLTMDVNVAGSPDVGMGFDEISCLQKNGANNTLDAWTDTLITGLIPFYTNTAEFGRAELWKIPEGTYDAQFYSVYEIAEAGTSASATQPAHQTTFTFRSTGGGSARIQLMESINAGNTRQSPPYSGAALTLANLIIGDTSIMLARDNTPVFANIALSQGQNERLFRKRFRQ